MKKILIHIGSFLLLSAMLFLASCNDFLNDIPKGQKTPKTWEDYNAFMKNNTFPYFEMDQLFALMGDVFKTPSALNSSELTRAHYYWDESVDRTLINSEDKNAYYSAYEALFYWNLIIEEVPEATECTEGQRQMLIAQAKVLRVMTYYYVANYYADQYCEQTKEKLSVPLVTSASVESASPQVTLEALYQFMLDDLNSAIDALPQTGESIFHPTKAAGYGMLARIYLSMGNYEKALENASLALEENDQLYDWIQFYNDDIDRFTDPTKYTTACKSDPEKENVENYVYHFSSMRFWNGISNTSYAITPERAAQFEEGDTRLLTHWKSRVSSSGIPYYSGIYGLEPNKGGIRTPEMYYIKAECLARRGGTNDIQEAMNLVNKVRKTRILPEYYQDWSATDTKDAVRKIIADKASEYIQNQLIFCDYRRLNKDPEYAFTLTKTIDGTTYTLSPDSHLWIMPFPIEVLNNPGNGTITQNVDK